MEHDEASLFHDHSTIEGKLSMFLHRIKWKYLIPPAVFLAAFAGIAIMIVSLTSELDLKSNNDNVNATTEGLQQRPRLTLGSPPSFLNEIESDSSIKSDNNAAPAAATAKEDEDNILDWTVITQPSKGVILAEGCENGLYTFEGFDPWVPVATAKSLKIRDLVINANELTQSLNEWKSLETIVIENVWVNGNFSRVYLPNLKKFIFHQFRNGKTDQYKQSETLKQTLFFEKDPAKSWNLNRDLLNLNITVQVSIEGTKILDIEPDYGEININTHTCEDMLKHFDPKKSFPLTTLSLNWCPVKNATLEKLKQNKDTLEFLFLNNAVPSSTAELGEITDTLRNLRELHLFQRFHCDWPGYEIFLNVSNLPPTLETLSVTNLDLSFDDPGQVGEALAAANSVRNLSLDQYVGENVVNNFPSIFPNLTTLALFNVTQNRSYPLMEKVFFQLENKPELIVVTDLTRLKAKANKQIDRMQKQKQSLQKTTTGNSKTIAEANTILKVEEIFETAGIPKKASCFKLELCKENGTYTGRELTSFERNFLRYTRLAFRKIDTYADYVTWDSDLSIIKTNNT